MPFGTIRGMGIIDTICGIDATFSVTDEEVNQAYNYLMSENLYRTKGVYASTRRSFMRRKESKPAEWAKYERLVRLCKQYKYNVREYVKFCLWHVVRGGQKSWQDPTKLCTLGCLEAFGREKANVERRSACYRHIYRSTSRICELCAHMGIKTFGAFMKWAKSSGRLSEMIYVGTVSRYIVAMIPEIERLAVEFDDTLRKTVQEMVLDELPELRALAVESIREYDRKNADKGVFAIINKAISKAQKPLEMHR